MKKPFILPIATLYFYDGRTTIKSRKTNSRKPWDFTGHSKTLHGAKRAAYRHLDKDYGDARKAIIVDLRTGLEVWELKTTAEGIEVYQRINDRVESMIEADIKDMLLNGKRI